MNIVPIHNPDLAGFPQVTEPIRDDMGVDAHVGWASIRYLVLKGAA